MSQNEAMTTLLAGRKALVTGASRRLGRAMAIALARHGATPALHFRGDASGAEETAAVIAKLGTRAPTVSGDLADADQCTALVGAAHDALGGLDILINNAGIYASLEMRPFDKIPVDEWRKVMDINVLSMFLTCRAIVPIMREQGGGKIVNISSGTPFRGVPFLLHYVTSKGAVVALTRSLAKELGADGIYVNCVAPGFTVSDGVKQHPEVLEVLAEVSVSARTIKREQTSEDVVGAAVFLCGDGADFITGQTMVIDGGQYFH